MLFAEATHLRTGKTVVNGEMTLMHLCSIWTPSILPIIMIMLFALKQMDSHSVIAFWKLQETLSIEIVGDTAGQVKIDITKSKGMCHHSPIRFSTSHAHN